MQDINNKLHDLLEGLTSFFEHYSDQSADQLATLQAIDKELDGVLDKLDTLAEQNAQIIGLLADIKTNTAKYMFHVEH